MCEITTLVYSYPIIGTLQAAICPLFPFRPKDWGAFVVLPVLFLRRRGPPPEERSLIS